MKAQCDCEIDGHGNAAKGGGPVAPLREGLLARDLELRARRPSLEEPQRANGADVAGCVDDEFEDGDAALKDRVQAAVGKGRWDAEDLDWLNDVAADAENLRCLWRRTWDRDGGCRSCGGAWNGSGLERGVGAVAAATR